MKDTKKKLEKEVDAAKVEEDKPSTELIDKANAAAERMEKANVEKRELLQKEEALKVERTLGGTAEAGQKIEETDEEKITREAKEMMASTGMNIEPEENEPKP